MALTSDQRIARLKKRLIELQQWIVIDSGSARSLDVQRGTLGGRRALADA